jgi:hypothetical protein
LRPEIGDLSAAGQASGSLQCRFGVAPAGLLPLAGGEISRIAAPMQDPGSTHAAPEIPMACAFDELRQREFSRLDAGGHAYLDYAGSGLYGESQVRAHAELLTRSVLRNPHSRHPTSMAATELVERTRERILAFFDGDPGEYEVILTPKASAAPQLVGES